MSPRLVWKRTAARAIILDDRGRVLLMRASAQGKRWLETPGGGVDRGEAPVDTARREVGEEAGYTDVEMGRLIARRHVRFRIGGVVIDQDETFHAGRLVSSRRADTQWEAVEAQVFEGEVWLTPDEVADPPARLDPPELGLLVVLAGSDHDVAVLPDTDLVEVIGASDWRPAG